MTVEEQSTATPGPSPRPTLLDIAERAGLSLRTTKKVMGGREYVPDSTRRRVLEAAEEIGYKKNTAASLLAQSKQERVAVVYNELTSGYFPELVVGFDRFADDHFDFGFSVEYFIGSGDDISQQRRVLERLVDDATITSVALQPLSSSRLDDQIAALVEAGKPVVTFGADAPASKRLAYVGPDAYKTGRIGAQILANYIGKVGETLVVYRGTEHMQTQERRRGFADRIAEHYPSIRVRELLVEETDNVQTEVIKRVTAQPPAGIFSTYADSWQVGKALEAMGRDDIPLVGFDASAETAELMRSGYMKVLLEQNPTEFAYRALKILFDNAYHGLRPPAVNHTEVTILTSECLP